MNAVLRSACDVWIIGYGNPQRRDDGLGPFIVKRLGRLLRGLSGLHLRTPHQLMPELADDLKTAGRLLFVDAALPPLAAGRQWHRLGPEQDVLPYLCHQVTPASLLRLLDVLYNQAPPAWMVSVQGDDFGYGCGLSPAARKRSERVLAEIEAFVTHRSFKTGCSAPSEGSACFAQKRPYLWLGTACAHPAKNYGPFAQNALTPACWRQGWW